MNYKKTILFVICAVQGIFCGISAQNNDEQGMEIPKGLELQQDVLAFKKAKDGWWSESQKNYKERIAWYKQAKFGCFIHWGPSSVPAGIWKGKRMMGYTEHLMRRECIPLKQYIEEVTTPFNPTEFDAEEWMKYAHDAGMKFFIITAKHHDGFAMYPSDAYPFDIRTTHYKGVDFMDALRKAARKYNIKFGFYYSHAFDWEHPDAPGNDWDYKNHPGGDKNIGGRNWWKERPDFIPHAEKYVAEKSIPQIQELIKKYDPDIMWFDTPHKLPLYLNIRILEAIREVDPENKIVVNGRLARVDDFNFGDYWNTGDRAAYFPNFNGIWESIPTTNESYGYSKVDTVRKSIPFFIKLLSSAASKGGNILLNVGPMGNGEWDRRDVNVLEGIGKWLKVNGESIYGTTQSELPIPSWGVTTLRNDTLYAHVFDWPKNGKLVLGGLRAKISKAWMLADKQASITYSRINKDDYILEVPMQAPDSVNSVIAIVMSTHDKPNKIRLLDDSRDNILYTFDANLKGKNLSYGDGKPTHNFVTNWTQKDESISWNFRLNKKTDFNLYLDYNTSNATTDSGCVRLNIAGKTFKVPYIPYSEEQGINSLYVGKITIDKGEYSCTLTGIEHKGKQFMRPIAVRLEK